LPQAPQFWLSVATVLHWPLQSVWPVAQLFGGVLVGFAQLAISREPTKTEARRSKGERGRVFIDLPRR
jgi:hypothetical protein